MDNRIKGLVATGVGAVATGLTSFSAAAQDDDLAAAGNGGTATASADGGGVAIGDVNSGGNFGSLIGVGDTHDGAVAVDGGSVTANTSIGITADGGTAIADASGGDFNIATTNDVNAFGFVS